MQSIMLQDLYILFKSFNLIIYLCDSHNRALANVPR